MSAPEQNADRSSADVELAALRSFLYEHVESLEELAVLAALRARPQAGPAEVEALVLATDLPAASVEEALGRLSAAGSVSPVGDAVRAFAFVEPDGAFTQLLERAIAEYRRNPLQVMALMTANAIERVRGAARRTFGESAARRRTEEEVVEPDET